MTTDYFFLKPIWSQFGASLEMLENAIKLCPDELWDNELKFWYNAYHAIFWTDYYLTREPKKFNPPAPFDFSEFDPNGVLPNRMYTKTELLYYLEHCRQKAINLFNGLTQEQLEHRWINDYKNYSLLEIIMYNLRHIQHHSAQLNLLLRQNTNNAAAWVSQASIKI